MCTHLLHTPIRICNQCFNEDPVNHCFNDYYCLEIFTILTTKLSSAATIELLEISTLCTICGFRLKLSSRTSGALWTRSERQVSTASRLRFALQACISEMRSSSRRGCY